MEDEEDEDSELQVEILKKKTFFLSQISTNTLAYLKVWSKFTHPIFVTGPFRFAGDKSLQL